MKKYLLVVFALSIGLVIGFVSRGIVSNSLVANDSPVKPYKVPQNAIWSGGADGGMWISCEPHGLLELKCKVFADVTGVLVEEGIFVSESSQMKPIFYSEGMIDLRTRYSKSVF